jgi:HK97 family phage major capsid protein
MPSKALEYLNAANEIIDRCEREGRDPTAGERKEAEGLLTKARVEHGIEERFAGWRNGSSDLTEFAGHFSPAAQDPGSKFIESEGYKKIKSADGRPQQWSSGVIDTGEIALLTKGTLLETPAGGGAGLVSVPQMVPGVVDKLFQPLNVERVLLSGPATGNTVRYATEGTATSGAAGVAEGGTKPESSLGYVTADEPIKKIATMVPISEELLEDAPAIQQFVNSRLALFVNIEAERQLLRGTSGGNEVQGLLTSRSVPVYVGTGGALAKADHLFKAMNGMRGSAFVEPEWILMNPADWQDIRLVRDGAGGTVGQYFGGGPFLGSYGGGAVVEASPQLSGAADILWNKPVYVTSALGPGTALVGNSQSAKVWNRGGLRVEATNSHSNYFQLNLVAIRAERRLGLTVFRSNGFVEVRLS